MEALTVVIQAVLELRSMEKRILTRDMTKVSDTHEDPGCSYQPE